MYERFYACLHKHVIDALTLFIYQELLDSKEMFLKDSDIQKCSDGIGALRTVLGLVEDIRSRLTSEKEVPRRL